MALSFVGFLSIAVLAHSLTTLAISLVIAGAGHTLAGTATKVLVAREVPVRRHGLAFGMQMAAIPLAAVLAGLAVPAISEPLGWRWAFLFGAALPAIGVAVLPRDHTPTGAIPSPRGFNHVHLRPLFVLGAVAVMASAAATTTATFYIVAAEEVGLGPGTAGILLSATSGVVIAVRIAFGVVADRFESGHLTAVVILLAASSLGYVLMATGLDWLFALGALVALVFGWSWPGLMVFALVRAYPDAPGLASAFVVGGMNLGSVVGPLAFGVLSDATSATTAFGMVTFWTIGASLACAIGQTQLRQWTTPAPA
jgi:predicted MFS family arabinose efflux permease